MAIGGRGVVRAHRALPPLITECYTSVVHCISRHCARSVVIGVFAAHGSSVLGMRVCGSWSLSALGGHRGGGYLFGGRGGGQGPSDS